MNTCVMQINKMPKLISRCINCGTQQLSMVSKVTKKKEKICLSTSQRESARKSV